ncbi:hypothetical protein, partial [Fictibacillus sp. 18YEL24]|uniref:hypothetical protein n=1 Tax=Fictibacillus sp. 18YEL24 TaxID=2745875 RepID=UPI001E59E9A2
FFLCVLKRNKVVWRLPNFLLWMWGRKARGIELGLGRERLSRISEMPLFLIFDLIEARFDLIYSHFDLILCIPT